MIVYNDLLTLFYFHDVRKQNWFYRSNIMNVVRRYTRHNHTVLQ